LAKASDLLNKSGAGALPTGHASNPLNTGASAKDSAKAAKDAESVTSHKPDLGHNLHKGTDKSKGGGGQISSRPKV